MNLDTKFVRGLMSLGNLEEEHVKDIWIVEKYSIIGFVFGLLFPLGAWLFDIYQHDFSLSINSILLIHDLNPIHFIVDSAPIMLGAVAHLVGLNVQKITKEQNYKLEKAYNHLSFFNKRINDSIVYAEKIQSAIVVSRNDIESCFKKSFLFHKPKDVIGGDFFWCTKKENIIDFGVIDCTGHGVPGAMMTMVAHLLLEKESSVNGIGDPAKSLESLDKEIKKALKQEEEENYMTDGMDLSLCRFNTETRELIFAGANRPIYLTSENEVQVIKGTRRGLGGGLPIKRTFENHKLTLNKGQRVFLFSDGVVDQFNEAGNEKFSSKRLHELLKRTSTDSFEILEKNFRAARKKWKGTGAQTDDCVLFAFEVE